MKISKHIRLRSVIVGVFFSVLYTSIGARALYLHVFCGQWLSEKARSQYKKSYTTNGKRGIIYDTNYKEMAVSIDVTSIAAYPEHIKDAGTAAETLSSILDIDAKQLLQKLSSNRSFVWIKRHVTPKQTEAIKKLGFSWIDFLPERSRFYPGKTLAAQLIGFTGIDGHGLEGIEFYYDSHLKGSAGKHTIIKDALGRGFNSKNNIIGHNGNNLVLTIDRTIQFITESVLEETVTEFEAISGMAVVMNPKSGAILALANFPLFNQNVFCDFDRERWRNRVVTDPFEPGSTMKIFLAAAGIETGYCTPNTIFYCEEGRYRIEKNFVHDSHSYGWLSLQQIIKYSSNIGMVKVTEKIGKNTLYTTLRNFGFGTKTGIDCPGETSGSIAPYKKWSRIDAGAISFGQGISVSAIQLISATSAIANDGIRMKPFIVKAITDQNGRLIKGFSQQQVGSCISAKTAETIRKIMMSVVTKGGTGYNAALEGYSVCGKTGTAQKIDETGKYSEDKYIASFIGFVPAENPAIAILVAIDEPQFDYYGGKIAAPAFKKIAYDTLNYLNIPPQKSNYKLTASAKSEATE